jgi:hypothetical protein
VVRAASSASAARIELGSESLKWKALSSGALRLGSREERGSRRATQSALRGDAICAASSPGTRKGISSLAAIVPDRAATRSARLEICVEREAAPAALSLGGGEGATGFSDSLEDHYANLTSLDARVRLAEAFNASHARSATGEDESGLALTSQALRGPT